MTNKPTRRGNPLSREEQVRVLQLLSDGKAQKEIAAELSINRRTVEATLVKFRREFSSSNNERVIKLATQKGLIA